MKFYHKVMLEDSYQSINYYKAAVLNAPCIYYRDFYEKMLLEELERLTVLYEMISNEEAACNREAAGEREFTLEELSKYNGAHGTLAYVAINGAVYDVSVNPGWGGGTHFGLYSGKDLTEAFSNCHRNNLSILGSLPKVGVIKSKRGH